jgi:hypothetical protein
MKILKRIVLWLLIVIVAVSLLAQLLPSDWKVSRSIVINVPAAAVYPYIENPREWAKWNSFTLEDPSTRHAYSGPAAGVSAEDDWTSKKFGSGHAKITQADPGSGVEYDLYLNGAKEPAKGYMLLTSAAGGTQVTYSVEGKYGHNPVHRVFGLFVDKFLGAFFERSLAHLKEQAESTPAPAAATESSPSAGEASSGGTTPPVDRAAGTAAGSAAGGGIQTGRAP